MLLRSSLPFVYHGRERLTLVAESETPMTQLNLTGTTVGRFEVLDELGRGGMAVVYKARQPDLDRIVALKVLPPELTIDNSYVARFRQEARSAARLEHPHIVPIYEVGEADGLHFIAMKYIQGSTLKDLVQAEGKLSIQRAAEMLGQIGAALDYAHRQGVIHRDIKPSNMMITDEGWVYLTDFGLARGTGGTAGLTITGTVMGTPEYMSPEQAQGLPNVGPPTDIYALGVVLYEMLTGSFPFKAETPMGMLAARLIQAPIPARELRADLPDPVEDVVMRALARKPEARFASASELVANLRSAAGLGSGPLLSPPLTPVAGLPALGETIAMHPSSTPPYVRPAAQPVASQPAAGSAARPFTVPATPSSAPVAGPPPTAQRLSSSKRLSMGKIIGGAAIALGLTIGGVQLATRGGPGPVPSPPPSTVAVQDLSPAVKALIESGDVALAREGGMAEALSNYLKAVDGAPQSVLVLRKATLAASLRADWTLAEDYANRLIDAAGSADDSGAALGYTLLAEALAARGDAGGALEQIDDALGIDDRLALAHAVQSNILADLALLSNDRDQMDEALKAMDQAVDTVSAEADPLIKALTYNAIGGTFAREAQLSSSPDSLEQSKSYVEKAIGLQGQFARLHASMGYLLSQQEDYPQARVRFEQALDRDRNSTYAQIGIGWSYFAENKYEDAISAFDKAIRLDPAAAEAYYGRGRSNYRLEQYDAAVSDLEQATTGFARNPAAFAWLGESLLFQGYNGDGDAQQLAYKQAAEAYRSAIDLNERYTLALTGLGWILQYQDAYDESIKSFERSLAIDDQQHEAENGLAWSLFNLDDFNEALTHFQQATEFDPTYANAFFGLGRTYEALERIDEARIAYQQSIDADDSDDDTRVQKALDDLK